MIDGMTDEEYIEGHYASKLIKVCKRVSKTLEKVVWLEGEHAPWLDKEEECGIGEYYVMDEEFDYLYLKISLSLYEEISEEILEKILTSAILLSKKFDNEANCTVDKVVKCNVDAYSKYYSTPLNVSPTLLPIDVFANLTAGGIDSLAQEMRGKVEEAEIRLIFEELAK